MLKNKKTNIDQIKQHKSNYHYAKAREFILSIDNYEEDDEYLRVLAECYYKDLELHKDYSYETALNVLNQIQKDTNKKKTLCLKGAIYKRKWEYQNNLEDLYKAIALYEQAYNDYKIEDAGYGAINASYLYDVLANETVKADEEYASKLSKKADEIREDIIKEFDNEMYKDNLWVLHTLAQAYLGIRNTTKCKDKLSVASHLNPSDWEIFTTYKQLRQLAILKNIDDLEYLLALVGDDYRYILTQPLDKKGLALSGGGFRASFFHLGTLAKLAQYNLLKDIEVISTVSGGSIIGVIYYLKLKSLLETKTDDEITHQDYIDLVDELVDEFYDIVKKSNIRNSVFYSDILKTMKFLNPFSSYSRTNRLGELYQEKFYKKYKTYMSELKIIPKDTEEFKPRFDNWRRKNRVPILVINATNLNSGHNWQFHATKMGEPAYVSDLEIDKNNRFEWIKYDDDGLKNEYKNYTIGQAVACSSAVPLLFTPIVLKDLYKGYELSLSDGGLYDNQGFSGLLSEECDFILCSDASGQMDNQIVSHTSLLSTNIRTIDIQMDRNRELLFEDINTKNEKDILKGFLFTHLKQGLKANTIMQDNQIQKVASIEDDLFQEYLSNIRTDLDTFSRIEAYSLMYNGYSLFQKQLEKVNYSVPNNSINHNWIFTKIQYELKNNHKEVMTELYFAKNIFFRKFKRWWSCR